MKLLVDIDYPKGSDIAEMHCAAAVDRDGKPVEGKWVVNAVFRLSSNGKVVNPIGIDSVRRILVLDGDSMPSPDDVAGAFYRKLIEEGWED